MSIATLQDAGRLVIEAWRRYDKGEAKLRARYLGPGHGPADVDAYESQLHGLASQRDSEIRTIRERASHENANDEKAIKSRLARDSGKATDDAINAAWRDRILPRLISGFALDDILTAPGLTRADVSGIRSNYGSFVAAKVGPDGVRGRGFEDEMVKATRRLNAAERGLLGDDVAAAYRDSEARDGAEAAMNRALAYDHERREGRVPMPLDSSTELSLAYGIAEDLGLPAHEPGRREWKDLVATIDPEMAARAARDTLDPETRARVDADAKRNGFDQPARSAEPSLRVMR